MANQTNNADREIDLSEVSQKIKGAVSRTGDRFFDLLLFLRRNIIIVVLLVITGAALGMYLDRSKTYTHKLYVIPNFGSVDYLYAKVDHLNAKLKENDKAFFQSIGLNAGLGKVEIEPVIEIYKFVEGDENKNYEMFKLMTDNNDITTVMEDDVTGRNFKRHVISFRTRDEVSRKDVVEPMMRYFNSSEYYTVIQREAVEHLKEVITTNDSTLSQINAILNDFSRSKAGGSNSSLMYYNDNTNLNDLIKLKNKLVKEQGENKIDLLNSNRIIQDSEVVLNDKNTEGLAGKRKYILPVILVLIFIAINRFRSYYRRQMRKRQIAAE